MPWCPICKEEYEEGIGRCADCGAALVEEAPEAGCGEVASAYEGGEPWEFLVSAAAGEADVIASLLQSMGIPVLRRSREAGDYLNVYMGYSVYGVDLYVPRSALQDARAALSPDALARKEEGESPFAACADESALDDESERDVEAGFEEASRRYGLRRRWALALVASVGASTVLALIALAAWIFGGGR